MKCGDLVYIVTDKQTNTTKGETYFVEVVHSDSSIEIYDDLGELSVYTESEYEPVNQRTELGELWERLRIMNRSLEEDLRQNEVDYLKVDNMEETEQLYLEYAYLLAKQELMNEIMEILEGMMEK